MADDHHTAEARTAGGVAATVTVDRAAVAVVVEEVRTEGEGVVEAVTAVPAGALTVAGVTAATAADRAVAVVATQGVAAETLTGSRKVMLAHVL